MFDVLLLLIVGVSIFFAAVRGGVRELATLAVLALAALIAWALTNSVAGAIGQSGDFIATAAIAAILGTSAFLAGYFLLHKGMLKLKFSRQMRRIDRIGGGVFGLLRALALIGLGFLGYGYYLDEANQPDAVRKALLLPVASAAAGFFEQFAPANRELTAAARAKNANAPADGYDNRDRSGLKEIVTTVTTTEKAAPKSADDPIADILTEAPTDDGEPDRQ